MLLQWQIVGELMYSSVYVTSMGELMFSSMYVTIKHLQMMENNHAKISQFLHKYYFIGILN